jgi:serine/threonine protein kinase
MSFEIGTVIGDYQVVELLGAGGMGKVYKVRNLITDRFEAMKVLLPNLDTDQELLDRFLREIKVTASLDHPNITALHTAQRLDNQLLMIMEFVEGYTIESLMRRGRIPLAHAIDFAMQVLDALAYAHARAVIHRDIKPANMMLTPRGVVKIMDFGIAKINDHRLTQTGRTVGSLFYMSPEQIRGDSTVDARADVYSLGVSLYEMATGRRPFEGDSDYSLMAAHLQQQPLPPLQIDPSLPEVLSDIILMSLAKDPAQRFQTADAFRSALDAARQMAAPPIGVSAPAPAPQGYAPPLQQHTAQMPVAAMPPPPPMFAPPQPSPTHPSQQQMRTSPTHAPTQYEPPPQFPRAPQQQFRPVPPPQAQSSKSHRGVYMLLGSLLTVGIIVAAAIYVPKMLKTRASDKTPTQVAQVTPSQPPPQSASQTQPAQPSNTQQQPPADTPASQPPTAPPQETAQQPPVTQPAKAPVTPKQPSRSSGSGTPQVNTPVTQHQAQMPQPSTPPPPSDPVPNRQVNPPPPENTNAPPIPQPRRPGIDRPNAGSPDLEELTHQKNLMMARIHAVNESMTRLREQNERNGLGVNPELVASQKRMGFFMDVATDALHAGNVAEARTSLANAERELDKLERRFGH